MEKFNQTATFQRWLIAHLRRISYRYGPRFRVKKAASRGRGQYECAVCKEIFASREVQLDHIEPVIGVSEGFKDWNTFITRLFVDEEGYQVLCKPCHAIKTVDENKTRSKERPKRGKKITKKKGSRTNRKPVQASRKKKKSKVGAKR